MATGTRQVQNQSKPKSQSFPQSNNLKSNQNSQKPASQSQNKGPIKPKTTTPTTTQFNVPVSKKVSLVLIRTDLINLKKKPTKELPTLADLMALQAKGPPPSNATKLLTPSTLPRKDAVSLQQPNPASSYVVQRFRTERAYAKHKKLSPLKKGILKEREDEFLAKFGEDVATEKKKDTIEKLEKAAEEEAERRNLPVRHIGDREKKDKYLKSLPKLLFNLRLITTEMETKIVEFLQILTKYQERAMADRALATARDVQPKKKKRFVMGIKEVLRGVRVGKVKMIICAPNIDRNPIENDRIESIIESAEQHNCPCIFGLNKKRLGAAVGKDIKISVVGIYNYDGADYKDLLVHARIHKLYYFLQQNALQQQKRLTAILETTSHKADNPSQINTNESPLESRNHGATPKDDGSEEDDELEIDVELNIMVEEQEEFETELYSIRTTLLGLDRVGPGRPKPTMLKKDHDKLTIFLQRINWPNTVVLTVPKTLLISELKEQIQNLYKNGAFVPVPKQVLLWNNLVLEESSLESNEMLIDYATIYVWSLKEYRNPVERAKHNLEPVHLPPAPLPVKKTKANLNAPLPATSNGWTNNHQTQFSPVASGSFRLDSFSPLGGGEQNGSLELKADSKEFKPGASFYMPQLYAGSYSYFESDGYDLGYTSFSSFGPIPFSNTPPAFAYDSNLNNGGNSYY